MEPNHNLVSLAVQDCFYWAGEAFQRMMSRPFPFLGLKELVLRQFHYDNTYSRGVFHWILKSPALEILDLQCVCVNSKRILDDTEAVHELCEALSENRTLKVLDLDECGTPDIERIMPLVRMLQSNVSIEQFTISNELELQTMNVLIKDFDTGGNQHVRTLHLGSISVSQEDAWPSRNALSSREPPMCDETTSEASEISGTNASAIGSLSVREEVDTKQVDSKKFAQRKAITLKQQIRNLLPKVEVKWYRTQAIPMHQ